MVHLGLGGQYIIEGGSAYASPNSPEDVLIETKKIALHGEKPEEKHDEKSGDSKKLDFGKLGKMIPKRKMNLSDKLTKGPKNNEPMHGPNEVLPKGNKMVKFGPPPTKEGEKKESEEKRIK
ncbi:unnamed protein product [Brassicogethes aeneus]|uniref:Uncharacterized protein n=1 Tax=Brassicogethes aeneus TaxID=1431903 RepID=A0A9P0AR65_BRAAE|nr:unnamed protein product [Brassicogethes aeneus]